MKILLFIALFILLMAFLSFIIGKKFVGKLYFSKNIKNIIYLFLILNFLGMTGYIYAMYNPIIPKWIYFLLSLPIGIIFLLFITTIIYQFFSKLLTATTTNKKRRNFFKKGLDITAVLATSSVNAKAIYNAKSIELEKVNINIKNLKKSYAIVQLSDIHIARLIDQKFMKNVVSKVNLLNPDIVVITGDLVDTKIGYAKKALNELKNLKSKYGTYFIVGNHEYYHGISSIIGYIKTLNIRVLENENVYIGKKDKGFFLAGVYDVMGYRVNNHKPDIKKALKGTKQGPTILLAHQPKFIEEVKNVDLMLSGHTHGGQIMPFSLLVKLGQPYIKGLHQHNKQTKIYVNKGTGFWGPPMRLGASSEITYITLLPA